MEREQEGLSQEQPINPEVVWGREFRISAVEGKGSGFGFGFANLHLPNDWQKAIPRLQEIDQKSFQTFFEQICRNRRLVPGEMKFDSDTGVLRGITINTDPISRLYLDTSYSRENDGIYRGEDMAGGDIKSLTTAITLQEFCARFLNFIGIEIGLENFHSYISSSPRAYYSVDLKIPKEFLESKEPVTNSHYRRNFEIQASNIAGRFGLDLAMSHGGVKFDERGIPVSFYVSGNACGYDLNSQGEYAGHNVDSPYQAAALHGIGASFINELLKRKDGKYY